MAEPPSPAAPAQRPLSPHLGIYRWQWTMALSILHRATGIVLAIGTLLLIYWLLAGALGKDAYAGAQAFFSQWFGRLLLFGWSAALFYHLFNGVRHLLWDAGKGFELRTAYASGLVVVAASIATTALAWIAGYAMK